MDREVVKIGYKPLGYGKADGLEGEFTP